jgi:hypothetical protein
MAYTTINKSTDYFNTKLYTGNGSTQSITGVSFQPDFTWLKSRSNANVHALFDAVRGVTKRISSNDNSAEYTEAGALTAFDSDGFSLGNWTSTNGNGHTLASWNWKANGQGSANTDGSINTTYTSANTTAGFSIVKYTGTGSVATVGHGLGAAPKMMIIRILDDPNDWQVYHQSIGNTHKLNLNTTEGSSDQINRWNDTSPTSSVFTLGTHSSVNASGSTYIAYCFAEKVGYSKFGSYTGNGNADGPFVYTGFKPSFVIIKNSSNAHNWTMIDDKRLGYNDKNYVLFPDLNNSEPTTSESDIVSNGFKVRASANGVNQSGNTMIYMAFGQSIVGSNNVPCTAR